MTAPNTHVAALEGQNGTIVTTPQTGAPISATSAASAAALAAIAQNGTAIPNQPGTTPETPIREVPGNTATQQPRASDGTFGTPLPADPNAPAAPAAKPGEQAAPAAGPDAQKPAEGAAEGEGTPDGDDPTLRLVPIEVNGETVDLDVGDAAIADVIRTHLETAREAETLRADAEREIGEALAVRDLAEVDPVGFVDRVLAESVAGQDHLVLSLLSRPAIFERLKPVVERMLADPAQRELVEARQQASRSRYADEARERIDDERASRDNFTEVKTACAAMARLAGDQARAQVIYNDMLRDLSAYADQTNVRTIPTNGLALILAARLQANGLDPLAASQAAAQAVASRPKSGARPRSRATASIAPRPAPAGAPLPNAPRPAPTGAAFVASAHQRRIVAIPAAGAGSPSVGPDLVPPANPDGTPMTIAQTTAWHRSQVALGKRALTR